MTLARVVIRLVRLPATQRVRQMTVRVIRVVMMSARVVMQVVILCAILRVRTVTQAVILYVTQLVKDVTGLVRIVRVEKLAA